MTTIEQKAKAYKRGVINSFKPFFMNGQISISELEFIANGATVKAITEGSIK